MLDAQGVGLPGASVAAYELHGQGASELPRAATNTDLDGFFTLSDLRPGQLRVQAHAPGHVPTASRAIRLDPDGEPPSVELTLRRGTALEIEVVSGTDGRPAPGATISWRDEELGLGGSGQTDARGLLAATGLPPGATLWATFRDWRAPSTLVPMAHRSGDRIRLALQPPVARQSFVIALEAPAGVTVERASFQKPGDSGTVCAGHPDQDLHWRFGGCAPGPGALRLHTVQHGTIEVDGPLEDGQRVVLPEPRPIELRVEGQGLSPQDWAALRLQWAQEVAPLQPAQLVLGDSPDQRRWRRELYPGRYDVALEGPQVGVQRHRLTLDHEGRLRPASVALETLRPLEIYVTDRRGAPLQGALIQLWRGEKLLEETTSGGHAPVRLRVRPSPELRLVALHPDVGEGSLAVELAARGDDHEPRQVVALDGGQASVVVPGRITAPERVGRALGMEARVDGEALVVWRLHPGGAAERAGVLRGDQLILVRRLDEQRYHLTIVRKKGGDVLRVVVGSS